MPNYCNGHIDFYRLSEKNCLKLRDCIARGKFCETVMPQPKEVKLDSRNEKLYWEADKEYRDKYGIPDKAWTEELKKKYPHKQLRYNWNCENWGTKWGMCDAQMTKTKRENDNYSFSVTFWTARSPLSYQVLRACTEKFDCNLHYEYSEPGMNFSGVEIWQKGECMDNRHFNDAYFGESTVCVRCGNPYGTHEEEDWYSYEMRICTWCGEEILKDFMDKKNDIKRIINRVDNKLDDDKYREKIIEGIQEKFNISYTDAGFILYEYNNGWFERFNSSQHS